MSCKAIRRDLSLGCAETNHFDSWKYQAGAGPCSPCFCTASRCDSSPPNIFSLHTGSHSEEAATSGDELIVSPASRHLKLGAWVRKVRARDGCTGNLQSNSLTKLDTRHCGSRARSDRPTDGAFGSSVKHGILGGAMLRSLPPSRAYGPRAEQTVHEYKRKNALQFLIGVIVFLMMSSSGFAQQTKIREVDNVTILRNHVMDLDRTRFIKGYYGIGDGGHGLFVFTNTILATNLGTRFQVAGQNYSWERQHDGMIDIRWFGARDGALDSTASIQAAVDYCSANNFTVVVPEGEYGIVSTILLRDNTRIVGTSAKSILFGQATTVSLGATSRTNVLLRDLILGGTSATQLKIDSSSDVRLERVKVTGATVNFGSLTAGIWIEGGGNIVLDRVHWYGNGIPTGTNATDYNLVSNFGGGTTTNLVILNPIVENLNSKCGLCLFGVNDPQVHFPLINMNNKGTALDNNGYAILVYGFDGAPSIRPLISGGFITNIYGSAVYFRNTIGGTISGVSIAKSSQLQGDVQLPSGGIVINIANGVRVINNGITNSGINSGINVCLTTNSIIAENVIELSGTNHWGIELRGNNFGTSIKGNTVKSGHRGIGTSISSSTIVGGDIEGNLVINFVDGINLAVGSSNNIVRGNRIYNNANAGILDLGSYNTFGYNDIIAGNTGIYAAGTDGLILPNAIQGQITALNIIGSGYRVDLIGRYHDNTIPINDSGGAIVKFITAGTTPSVKNSPSYMFNYSSPVTITDFTDGLIGVRKTFFTQNTNVTIAHSASINLDGAGNFNMKSGDSLTLEKDAGGGWRQVGKSINDDYIYVNRAGEQIIVNWPLFDFNTYYQQTTPSTTTYASDHILSTNTTGLSLVARWAAFGNLNGFTIKTSADKTNYLFGFNGTEYQFPITNALAGQILASSGGITNYLYWTNSSGGGSSYTFDPTQFSSGGGLVAVTTFATVTNLFLKGATRGGPNLNVSGVNIDASLGTEFSKTLASNTSMGIINMTNDQTIHIAFTNTTFTLSFTNTQMTWLSGIVPVINTNAVNVYHFHKKGDWIWASDPEQVANANIVALSAIAGTGVLVKTNATTIATFDPLPVVYGGTGTNSFSSVANGNVLFHNLTQNSVDTDDGQFLYSKSTRILNLNRSIPTGNYQLLIAEGSGGVPYLTFYDNRIDELNDDLTFEVDTGFNLLSKINGVTAFKVSKDLSSIIGDGTTTTTRTNKFLYLSTTAGIPTGVPAVETGTSPIVWDSSNNHLYIYDGSWIQLDGTGGGIINATDGVIPYRSSSTTFADSALSRFSSTQMVMNAGLIFTNAAPSMFLSKIQDIALGGLTTSEVYFVTKNSSAFNWGNYFDLVSSADPTNPSHQLEVYAASTNGFSDITLKAGPVNQTYILIQTLRGNMAQLFPDAVDDGVKIPYIFNTDLYRTNTAVPLFVVRNRDTNRFSIAVNSGYTGAGTLFLSDDGTYKAAGGGGGGAPVGTMVASGISTIGIVPATSDTTGTNYIASPLIVSAVTNILSRGRHEVNLIQSTNGVVPLDVAVSKLVRTASNNKLAAVTIGGGLTFDGTTLDVAGGGALAGSGTPTYYAQWTGAAALGDGGLYHIDATAVGLNTTNFFIHIHGGLNNIGIGEYALQQVDAGGTANNAFGRNSLSSLTTGDNNVAIGEGSMTVLATGDDNVAVGRQSLAAVTGRNNTMVGHRSGNAISSGTNNVGVGRETLNFTTTPSFNSALGNGSGYDNVTGGYNTYVGALSGYFDGNGTLTYTNTSQVGFGSLATNDNAVVLGNQNVNRWQLGNGGPTIKRGTSTPESAVNGNVGDVFIRTDGGINTTWYWKESGAGTTTGWVTKGGNKAGVARLHVESTKLPASNPARINPVSDYVWELLFDASTSQSGGYSFIMPQDYGSLLTLRFKTTVKSVQTGTKNVIYRFYVAAMKATEDPTAPTFSSANSVTVVLGNNQAANAVVESTVTLSNADSVVAGDLVILKVDRDAANGSDDATGDSALVGSLAVEWLKQ